MSVEHQEQGAREQVLTLNRAQGVEIHAEVMAARNRSAAVLMVSEDSTNCSNCRTGWW